MAEKPKRVALITSWVGATITALYLVVATRSPAPTNPPSAGHLTWDWMPLGAPEWTNVQFEVVRRDSLLSGAWKRYALVYTNLVEFWPTGASGAFMVRAGWRDNTNEWSEWNVKR